MPQWKYAPPMTDTGQPPTQTQEVVPPSQVTPATPVVEPVAPPVQDTGTTFWDDWKTGFKQMYGIEPVGTPIDVIKGYGKGLVSGVTMGAYNPETSGEPEKMGSQVGQFVGAVVPITAATKVAGGFMGAVNAFKTLTPVAQGALQTILASGIYTGATRRHSKDRPLRLFRECPEMQPFGSFFMEEPWDSQKFPA